jgi:hypothetical protein
MEIFLTFPVMITKDGCEQNYSGEYLNMRDELQETLTKL